MRAPQRVKSFMWLVINDALLTNCARLKRNMTANDTCAICGSISETMLHTLRDCSKAKEMWKSIDHSFIKDSFFIQPLSEWLEENVLKET